MAEFFEKIRNNWSDSNNVCLGLDFPAILNDDLFYDFLYGMIHSTKDVVCCYKTNFAFWLKDEHGMKALSVLCECINEIAPDAPLILDGKFGDVDNTNKRYAEFAFDILKADAVTVNPYVGLSALAPFFERKDKGAFILCSTSNEGSGEFQDDSLRNSIDGIHLPIPLYQKISREVDNKKFDNLGLVMGATHPERINRVRNILGINVPMLIPGVGAQGGSIPEVISSVKLKNNEGFIINSSQSLLLNPYIDRVLFSQYYDGLRERIKELQFEIDSVLYGLI